MLLKKKMVFALITIILFMFFSSWNHISAQEYPLDPNEKLLDKREISETTHEIFTEKNGLCFKKTVTRDAAGAWKIDKIEDFAWKNTGLKFRNTLLQSDSNLGQSIRRKLFSEGFSLDNLPAVVDYAASPLLPPVGAQNGNSCVGWAAGYYLRTFQQAKDIGWEIKKPDGSKIDSHVFSPSFIYNQINSGVDQGAYLEDAGVLLKNIGAASLADFPDIPNDYSSQPSPEVIAKAGPHKIREWKVLCTKFDPAATIVQKTKEYLNTGDLVVGGSQVGPNFIEPATQPDGQTIIITDQYIRGGHAYVIVGYDDNLVTPEGKGAFKIVSSWGTGWGDGGFSYLTYQAYTTNLVASYVFTDLINEPDAVKPLPNQIKNVVRFQISTQGHGLMNTEITDATNRVVYAVPGISPTGDLTDLTWLGSDQNGQTVSDGDYKLNIAALGPNGSPKPPFTLNFTKQAKVATVNSFVYSTLGVVKYVQITLVPVSDCSVDITVNKAGVKTRLVDDAAVSAGQVTEFVIDRSEFDFNNIYLAQTSIEIEAN